MSVLLRALRHYPDLSLFTNMTPQIKKLKSVAYKNVHKREKTVSRAYGGSLSGGAVRNR